jgi:hypothetical protein
VLIRKPQNAIKSCWRRKNGTFFPSWMPEGKAREERECHVTSSSWPTGCHVAVVSYGLHEIMFREIFAKS